MIVITFGTFDLFHIGHLNIITKCNNYNNEINKVIVGVSSDKLIKHLIIVLRPK